MIGPASGTGEVNSIQQYERVEVHTTLAQEAGERLRDGVHRVERLIYAGVPSAESTALRDDLLTYAWPVLLKMIRTGQIFELCGQRHRVVTATAEDREVLRTSRAERDALAVDTLLRAIDPNLAALAAGRWDPRAGASLGTYFVGACLNHFPAVLAAWRKDRHHFLLALQEYGRVEDIPWVTTAQTSDPAEPAALRDTVRRILSRVTPETRTICILKLKGLTYAEIASELRITEGAVTQRLYRLRKLAREMIARGEIEVSGVHRPGVEAEERGP